MNIGKNKVLLVSLLFIFLSFNGCAVSAEEEWAPLKINFVLSEACTLITFLDTISNRQHTTGWVKDWYFKKRSEDPAHEKLKDKESKLLQEYKEVSGKQKQFVDETGRELDFDQKMICLASDSSSIADFLPKLKEICSATDYEKLKEIFQYFAPVYNKMIWTPQHDVIVKQFDDFRSKASECKLPERLMMVQKFMKSPWVKGLSFNIVLVPMPDSEGHSTHGESLGRVQVVELLKVHEFEDQADVVFHEACHALWHSKPKAELIAFQNYFEKIGAELAYNQLNEGMATALGQGWFVKIAGLKDKKSWYMDKIINSYAHALYPLLAEYLDTKKSVDEEFAIRVSKIFDKSFPNAKNKIAFCNQLEICEEMKNPTEFHSKLRTYLPSLSGLWSSVPIDNDTSIKDFKENHCKHVAFLLAAADLPKLSAMEFTAEQIEKLKHAKKLPLSMKVGNREIIFCVADDEARQQEMLWSVLSKPSWPKPFAESEF